MLLDPHSVGQSNPQPAAEGIKVTGRTPIDGGRLDVIRKAVAETKIGSLMIARGYDVGRCGKTLLCWERFIGDTHVITIANDGSPMTDPEAPGLGHRTFNEYVFELKANDGRHIKADAPGLDAALQLGAAAEAWVDAGKCDLGDEQLHFAEAMVKFGEPIDWTSKLIADSVWIDIMLNNNGRDDIGKTVFTFADLRKHREINKLGYVETALEHILPRELGAEICGEAFYIVDQRIRKRAANTGLAGAK
jgi:hypothetical protein